MILTVITFMDCKQHGGISKCHIEYIHRYKSMNFIIFFVMLEILWYLKFFCLIVYFFIDFVNGLKSYPRLIVQEML